MDRHAFLKVQDEMLPNHVGKYCRKSGERLHRLRSYWGEIH